MENAEGIQISGIRFTGTTNSGITMTDCELCTISGCELYNISMDAIKIGDNNGMITADSGYDTFGGGHNNTVANCVILIWVMAAYIWQAGTESLLNAAITW